MSLKVWNPAGSLLVGGEPNLTESPWWCSSCYTLDWWSEGSTVIETLATS